MVSLFGRLRQNRRRRWKNTRVKMQKNRCFYCNEVFDDRDHLKRATLDHYEPLSKGGPDTFHNTVAACYSCNWAKDDMHGDEFLLTGAE